MEQKGRKGYLEEAQKVTSEQRQKSILGSQGGGSGSREGWRTVNGDIGNEGELAPSRQARHGCSKLQTCRLENTQSTQG